MRQTSRYTRTAIFLHWLLAILIIGQVVGGKYMTDFMADGPDKFKLIQMHKSFGILILLLTVLRLLWRLGHKPPSLPLSMPIWQKYAARSLEWVLYFLMIFIPITGWLMVSASPLNLPTQLFGTVPWPDFPGIARSAEGVEQYYDYHHILAVVMVILFIGHVGAALTHYFYKRDMVFTAMAPWFKPIKGKNVHVQATSRYDADNNV